MDFIIHKLHATTITKLAKRHVHVPNVQRPASYQPTNPPYCNSLLYFISYVKQWHVRSFIKLVVYVCAKFL